MILSALNVALALQALPAPGAVRWEELTVEPDGRSWLDPASLVREGDVARFTVRHEGIAFQREGIGAVVLRLHIRCASRQMGLEAADAYGVNGTFRETRQVGPDAIVFEALGTTPAHDAMYRRVCGAPARQG